MRKIGTLLSVSIVILFALPAPADAQGSGPPPPPCCRWDATADNDGQAGVPAVPTARIQLSGNTVRQMGFTRAELLDRLSESLFPGKRTDLVFSASRFIERTPVDRPSFELRVPGRLLTVEEKRFYLVSRAQIQDVELESIDQLYLTDGIVYVKVTFE